MTQGLTHLDANGQAKMVDVTAKQDSQRVATAQAIVILKPSTLAMVLSGAVKKGDVLTVARIAGIQAAKNTSQLIPLCHPLMLTGIDVDFKFPEGKSCILIQATCRVAGKTGVEMEALTAASVAALTIYDMCKGVEKTITITDVQLVEKRGGKSGDWLRTHGTEVSSE